MKVAVIGAGIMGPGIALSWLAGGHEVALYDIKEEALRAGRERIERGLKEMHEKNIVRLPVEQLIANLGVTDSLSDAVSGARLVVECVPEDIGIKLDVYRQLAGLLSHFCSPDVVVVSNTSALPLPEMIPDFCPGRFFICHYLNPPEIVPLVEIVRNQQVSDAAVDWLRAELMACGKTPVVLNGYKPGFLINRLQAAMMREAFHLLQAGLVTPHDLDRAVRDGIGFKSAWQGLFETLDYIGLDTVAMACNVIFPDLSNESGVPTVIKEKVAAGHLGVKSGQGFYTYTGKSGQDVLERRREMLLAQLTLWRTANTC